MTNYLARLPRSLHVAAGVVLLSLVGLIDYLTGADPSLLVFYLLPIALVTWYAGQTAGMALATGSAIVLLVADLASGRATTQPVIVLWNTLTALGLFAATSAVLAALRREAGRKPPPSVDALTGVSTAERFREVVVVEKDRAVRYKHPLTLACIDVDAFGEFNERFGRPVGDLALRSMAAAIQSSVRTSDTVARLGGDSFALLLVESEPQQAQTVLARTRQRLLEVMRHNSWPVTFCLGAITFFNPSSSAEEMIGMVESLMAVLKSEGRDCIKYEVYRD